MFYVPGFTSEDAVQLCTSLSFSCQGPNYLVSQSENFEFQLIKIVPILLRGDMGNTKIDSRGFPVHCVVR